MQYLSQNQAQDTTQQSGAIKINASEHPEVSIPQELKHAIEKGPDAQELKVEELTNTKPTQPKESTPVITTPAGLIHLPMTYEQALKKKNTTPFWDSIHWLAAFVVYQWVKYDPDVVRASKTKKTKTN